MEEGRKKEGRNPHLPSSRRNDPTCLNFGVWRVSLGCLECAWRVSMGCLNGNLVSQNWSSPDRSSPDRSSQNSSSQDRSSWDRLSPVRTGQVLSRQVKLEIVRRVSGRCLVAVRRVS